jgi:hypothetical protein
MIDKTLKQKAIDLRVSGRKSFDEISAETGLAKGTLSYVLKEFPLTTEEIKARQREHAKTVLVPNTGSPKKYRGNKSKFYSLLEDKTLSRTDKGRIAEAAVLFRLSLLQLPVAKSVFDGDGVDFLVTTPKRILKIQVKSAKKTRGVLPCISLKCSNGRTGSRKYLEEEVDFIVGYDLYTDQAYVYSIKDVEKNQHVVVVSDEHLEAWSKLLM